jgi:hypothetical protein
VGGICAVTQQECGKYGNRAEGKEEESKRRNSSYFFFLHSTLKAAMTFNT